MSAELDALLDRLFIVNSEINGLTVKRTAPPATVIKNDDFPLLYPIFTGFQEVQGDFGTVYRTYTFDEIVLVKPYNNKPDTDQQSQGIIDVMTWIDTISDHYNSRRLLKPTGYDDLPYLSVTNLTFNCEGTLLENPQNDPRNAYFMTVFNLAIQMLIEVPDNI